jgi:hypothetical protein
LKLLVENPGSLLTIWERNALFSRNLIPQEIKWVLVNVRLTLKASAQQRKNFSNQVTDFRMREIPKLHWDCVHPRHSGYHQGNKQQMLLRMCGERYIYTPIGKNVKYSNHCGNHHEGSS